MPLLDNLILGRPGGDRRQRYEERLGDAGASRLASPRAGELDLKHTTLRQSSPDGIASDVLVHGPRETQRRPCGNLACGRSWTLPWKSRDHPVFDGQWSCSQACLSAMVKSALMRETGDGVYTDGPEPHHHRVPLGLLMLAQGWITHPQLQRALEAQRAHGRGRIGEWLVSECGMEPERIARGLGAQWNCPVLSLEGAWPEAMALALPRVFLEEYGMVPLRVAGKKLLYVGYQDSLDAAASFALERMTGLRTESGVLPEAEYTRARETLLRCEFPRQNVATAGDRDGLTRAIAETVEHERPEASRLVRLHRYYWLRVWAKGDLERAVGDLPSNVNGVRDYLFTIGDRFAHAAQDRMSSRSSVPTRSIAVEEPIEVAAGTPMGGPGAAAMENKAPAETAVMERETPVSEEGWASTEPAARTEDAVDADPGPAIAIETKTMTEPEAYVEVHSEVGGTGAVSTTEALLVHFLARREFCFEADVTEVTRNREEPMGLEMSVFTKTSAEMEPIEGEYLTAESTGLGSTAPVPVGRPSSWSRFGLLRRLKPSFLYRGAGPASGPGQGV
jgi:hypothetical protein